MVGKSFGYHFQWDEDCGLGTHGYPTLNQAMWAAARELHRCMKSNIITPRKFRKILTKDERAALTRIARAKLGAHHT
jgi:hypothetical protein